MKKLFYSIVVVSVVLVALFTIGQLSTAQNKNEANSESENKRSLQETNRPQTGALTNGFTHTGVLQVGLTETWTITATANDSITARVGNVTPSGNNIDFYPRIRVIRPDGVILGDNFTNFATAAEVSGKRLHSNQRGPYVHGKHNNVDADD